MTGNAAVSWLGLGSPDESDEEKEDEIDFSLKPHFEGEQGQRVSSLIVFLASKLISRCFELKLQ